MGKAKTIKAIAKRFKVTRSGKVIKRTSGQDHYNRREPGKVTRHKRNDLKLSESHSRTLRKLLK